MRTRNKIICLLCGAKVPLAGPAKDERHPFTAHLQECHPEIQRNPAA